MLMFSFRLAGRLRSANGRIGPHPRGLWNDAAEMNAGREARLVCQESGSAVAALSSS